MKAQLNCNFIGEMFYYFLSGVTERETIYRCQSDFINGLGRLYVCAVPLNELQPLAKTDVESGTEWKGGWITNKLSLLGVFNVYTTSGASKHIRIKTTRLYSVAV